ncbi:TrmH family RNA methyltransferase [Patescibacteria group bacterium]|nr:TrmH family RNA methyltransferase [Patescibacteria group bacterium]
MSQNKEIYLILHNVRSLYNVGSIFRTADCAGVKKIFLTGYTPEPAPKTALGAEKTVLWEKHKNISTLISNVRSSTSNIKIVVVEQDKKAINYKNFKPKYPLVLILGNEVRGLSKQIIKKCDAIIEIPMKGKKESLNVAVAAGIILFSLN